MTGPSSVFEPERSRLIGIAYRMTGSHHDAEDIVQEAWIRFERNHSVIEVPAAWLTTTVTRMSIDRIRRLATDRARYVGPWLPEPVAIQPTPDEVVDTAKLADIGIPGHVGPPQSVGASRLCTGRRIRRALFFCVGHSRAN